jgi:low temperature requirement protein LtrA
MKGIEVPERTEDFTADPVELFFDLAFVFAFSQLVSRLIHDPTWSGVGETALLFWLIWLPWSQFTWAANAVSGNGRGVRVYFLVATAASMPMAASVTTAYDAGGPTFAISLCVIMAMGLSTMLLSVGTMEEHRGAIRGWLGRTVAAMAVLLVGSFLDGGARTVVWIVASLIIVWAMASAGQEEWIIRGGHFAERHGLILIIALGEIIVAIGLPVVRALDDGDGLEMSTLLALVASGAFAGLMWWAYFDRVSPALEHRADTIDDPQESGRYARDVYTALHAVIVAGVLLSAAALEEIALHPTDEVPDEFRMMLFAGVGLTLLAVVACVWRAFDALARERLIAVAAIGAVVAFTGMVNGIVVIIAVDLVIAAMLALEHARIER